MDAHPFGIDSGLKKVSLQLQRRHLCLAERGL